MFLGFDQRIDPAAVLPRLRIRDGAVALRVERVPAVEAREDRRIGEAIADAAPGTWIVVRPAAPLRAGRKIVVEAAAGVPSAEGPRVTTTAQQDAFFSAAPLELRDVACTLCDLDGWFELRFSKPLDVNTVAKAIRVEPPLPDMRVETDGHNVQIFGRKKASSRYKLTIDGSLADVHGQTLGCAASTCGSTRSRPPTGRPC